MMLALAALEPPLALEPPRVPKLDCPYRHAFGRLNLEPIEQRLQPSGTLGDTNGGRGDVVNECRHLYASLKILKILGAKGIFVRCESRFIVEHHDGNTASILAKSTRVHSIPYHSIL